ncbi:MAG: UDP-3-O-acyl-N-acetylglucosamine deacetylase [Armatimonadetes bacterium]|nr:UDP-3-O-acyl-N-acetylglucosamine deacetylase [Armatimonadota bacterium]
MTYDRLTLKGEVLFGGNGLHSGEPVEVRLVPSSDGIRFHRGTSVWPARPDQVTDTRRCTTIGEIATVEHLMSAFAGLGITDVDVVTNGHELPAAGGCSQPFVQAILEAGTETVGQAEIKGLFKRVFVQADSAKVAVAGGSGHWRCEFDAPRDRFPFEEAFESESILQDYVSQIAPARTTVFADEVEAARSAGLGKGLDESSCLILGPAGYVNKPRFSNEAVRHKMLDLIGDIYLAGVPISFLSVNASHCGHRINVEAAIKLRAMIFDLF